MKIRPSYCNHADLEMALRSEEFPYAIAVLQSRVKNIPRNNFMITDKEPFIVEKTKSILEKFLDIEVRQSTVDYGGVQRHRMWVWCTQLLDFISFQTKDNQRVPNYVLENPAYRENYTRGFLDSRASITFSPHTTKDYPRIIITKSNSSLLGSLRKLLQEQGLTPSLKKRVLRLHHSEDIVKILESQLITDSQKLEKLKELAYICPV
jgi:hypothetical protein